MERFIIVSPHTAEDCDRAIKEIHAAGYLHHFEWGCKDDDHTGYAILEAENHEHARQIVPWFLRERAHAARVVKFGKADPTHDAERKKAK
jgi:hypothetical protein